MNMLSSFYNSNGSLFCARWLRAYNIIVCVKIDTKPQFQMQHHSPLLCCYVQMYFISAKSKYPSRMKMRSFASTIKCLLLGITVSQLWQRRIRYTSAWTLLNHTSSHAVCINDACNSHILSAHDFIMKKGATFCYIATKSAPYSNCLRWVIRFSFV